jgi:primosomal protein N' (replication factor Y)
VYVAVVVNRPTHRLPPAGSQPLRGDTTRLITYTYRLPERLRDAAAVGHLVQVPLGPGTALGVVAGLLDDPPEDLPPELEIRDVMEILDPLPVVTPAQIALARWIADEYLAPLNQALRLMLPPDLGARTYVVVRPAGRTVPRAELNEQEAAALRLLQGRKKVRLSTLLSRIPGDDPEASVHSLADRGLVSSQFAFVPPKPAPPRIRYVRMLADDEVVRAALPRLGRASKQADALLVLARRAGAPLTLAELCQRVGSTEGPVRSLEEKGYVRITPRRMLVVAQPDAAPVDLGRAYRQAEALQALLQRGGTMEWVELQAETGISPSIVAALEGKGLVQRVHQESVVLLRLDPGQVLDRVIELRGAQDQAAVLQVLAGTTGRVWVGGLYAQTGADLSTLRALAERGLISLHAEEYDRPTPLGPQPPPHLSPDQAAVWREIQAGMAPRPADEPPFVALLHGVTGSGKTEIYLRALQATLEAGQRAIVLVPEISLTAQTVRRFEARFPGRVAVMHSQLSLGQRYAAWDRIRRGEADVVIGPRSALFAPISRLGLIVLDESHEGSYKQEDPIPLPSYHARDAAVALAGLTGAAVILGTATPDLVTYSRAQGPPRGGAAGPSGAGAAAGPLGGAAWRLLELPKRILTPPGGDAAPRTGYATAPLPPVRVVDLRQELRAGNRSIFSRALQEALDRTLSAGEQAILFLNRRGAATFVLCRDCGYVARCPRCDVPLTHHAPSSTGHLLCHHCNYREPAPERCPACGGGRIRYFGLGTERVEQTLRQRWPEARLLRWDRDTASGADHERFLQAFIDHRADILVGTQMIAKGLDLPRVTLVGVISADTALYLPDYRAAERTFQLLAQVAGRAGRSRAGGRVIVQTYNPEHYAIQAAARHDYAAFARQEMAYRRELGYPPFGRLVALRLRDENAERCQAAARGLGRWVAAKIRRTGAQVDLIGPVPCFFSRVGGKYRWQIVLRGPDPRQLLADVALPYGWRVDVDPLSLL